MNERFWEIVNQADEQGGDDPDIRDQLFAELLIKDFQDMIKQVYLATDPEHRACLLTLDAKVEEHFGVEE